MVHGALETECSSVRPSDSRLRDPIRQQQQENPNRQWNHQSNRRKDCVYFDDLIFPKQSPNQCDEQSDINRDIYPDDHHQFEIRKHLSVQREKSDDRQEEESERRV